MLTRKPTALSIFSGCGGFCEGIELAEFHIKAAVELDQPAAETYRCNFPSTPLFVGDISKFLRTPGNHKIQYGLEELDLIFGGPPCQGYSQIGPRDLGDPRNLLFAEFARVVRMLRPKMFLMENVPNLLLLKKGHFRDLILAEFARIGYRNTTYAKVTAADYSVPQLRHRVVFVGIRDDLQTSEELSSLVEGTLKNRLTRENVTVQQAIGDLPGDVVPSGEPCHTRKKGGYPSFSG